MENLSRTYDIKELRVTTTLSSQNWNKEVVTAFKQIGGVESVNTVTRPYDGIVPIIFL